MIAPAPVQLLPGGRLRLDVKFVEGMRLHVAQWRALTGGGMRVILWEGGALPFGIDLGPEETGFDLTVLPPGVALTVGHLAGARLVFASADMDQTLDLAPMVRAAGARLVYAVEYTLETRLRILRLDGTRSGLRKLRSALWLLGQERRRRAAIRAADGLQANGWPAEAAYRRLSRDCLMYLDGRMRRAAMADPAEMRARAAHMTAGGPLRIVHSGRLEPMKGAQDLLPVARALIARGVAFTLDIWGDGSAAPGIARAIAAEGLGDRIRLHAPVPFDTELVPAFRSGGDLFLSCHRQSDPSCSYIEAMGCGLAVAGYDNRMWRALQAASGGGRVVPMGDVAALADAVAGYAARRDRLAADAEAALRYAQEHDFETEFSARMSQLARIAIGSG